MNDKSAGDAMSKPLAKETFINFRNDASNDDTCRIEFTSSGSAVITSYRTGKFLGHIPAHVLRTAYDQRCQERCDKQTGSVKEAFGVDEAPLKRGDYLIFAITIAGMFFLFGWIAHSYLGH